MLNRTVDLLAEIDRREIDLLRDRIVEAEAEGLIPAELVEEWVGSWFTSGELPPPEPPSAG